MFLLAAGWSLSFVAPAGAQGTAFTYQGRLLENGSSANGSYDVRSAVFPAASGGSPVAGPLTNSAVAVSNGLFTAVLDFGAGIFNGNSRWLEIAVRPAGGGNFTTLNPRQPMTPAPYAIFAANAGAGGGSPWSLSGNNTFYNAGNVGIGTTSFGSLLTVGSSSTRGTLNVVGSSTAAPAISLTDPRFVGGGNQYSIYSGLSSFGNLDIYDQFAGAYRFTISSVGNIGIGTNAPQAKLHVRGDIRLGANGELRATSGEENLRIVRGVVAGNGNIIVGSGFSVSHNGTGDYTITFEPPFLAAPAITMTCDQDPGAETPIVATFGVTASSANVWTQHYSGVYRDITFHLIAVGPR
jgi:hypothetical protein